MSFQEAHQLKKIKKEQYLQPSMIEYGHQIFGTYPFGFSDEVDQIKSQFDGQMDRPSNNIPSFNGFRTSVKQEKIQEVQQIIQKEETVPINESWKRNNPTSTAKIRASHKRQNIRSKVELNQRECMLGLFNLPSNNDQAFYDLIIQHGKLSHEFVEVLREVNQELRGFQRGKYGMIKMILTRAKKTFKKLYKDKKCEDYFGGENCRNPNQKTLQHIYKNELTMNCLQKTALNFVQEFENENVSRIQKLLDIIEKAQKHNKVRDALEFLKLKVSRPWPIFWRRQLYRVFAEILENTTNFDPKMSEKLVQEISKQKYS